MSIQMRTPAPLPGQQPLYPLDDPTHTKQLDFFRSATNIQDPEELKSHIFRIREEAYKLSQYPCIWAFDFLTPKIASHYIYSHIREVAKKRSESQRIFIDFGAFLGTDLRQVVHDGWRKQDVLAVDVVADWSRLGCELFKDSDKGIPYFIGDIFNHEIFDPFKPSGALSSAIDLYSLEDLNVLRGRAMFISANFIFHLFGEEDQQKMAEYFALILSEEPGSTIFGYQVGSPVKGMETYARVPVSRIFTHSPESSKLMWEKCFDPTKVKIVTELRAAGPNHPFKYVSGDGELWWLYWSVTRL